MIKRTISLATLTGIILSAGTALASGGAEHGEGITFLGDWLPRLVNFGVLAGALVYFVRKPARDFFKNRTIAIEKSIQDSREARERAVAALAEMERKMKELDAETKRMVSDAQARGEKDKAALIEEGKKLVQDIQIQVKTGIEAELQKAKAALAVDAALLSVELAEGKIKDKIGKPDHERIVKEYVAKVGGRS